MRVKSLTLPAREKASNLTTANWSMSLLSYLTPRERGRLSRLALEAKYRWSLKARPAQLEPSGDWRTWVVLAGRGFGKTRTGAEWVRGCVEAGRYGRWAFVCRQPADARDIMIEGESGILAISRPNFMPTFEPSKRRIVWPNGATAIIHTSYDPDSLRGFQCDAAWCDELASWKYVKRTWDMLMLGLRLGQDPRCIVTTTPKPTAMLIELLALPSTVLTGGSTYENIANLAPAFIDEIVRRYEGTTLGQQELYAKILSDNPRALWKRSALDAGRVVQAPNLARLVVGIDPAATSQEGSDETGIVVAGIGADGQGYVLDDLSLRGSPHVWASQAVSAYHKYRADRIVAEINQGGEMVESTIRTVDQNVAYSHVYATRGKTVRAEPIAALYEQGRIHHVGAFAELEDQMCQWVQGEKSPDRIDALVWALTELSIGTAGSSFIEL